MTNFNLKSNTMKNLNIFLLALFAMMLVGCQNVSDSTEEGKPDEDTIELEEDLSEKYGADEYGMRKYVMAFLKKGPNRDLDSAKAADLQRAHLENIGAMAEAGKLALAGPFFGNDDLRGIYIFAVESIEEAEALTNTDPAIQAGSLVMELKEWYGSAGLMAVNEIHESLANTSITD